MHKPRFLRHHRRSQLNPEVWFHHRRWAYRCQPILLVAGPTHRVFQPILNPMMIMQSKFKIKKKNLKSNSVLRMRNETKKEKNSHTCNEDDFGGPAAVRSVENLDPIVVQRRVRGGALLLAAHHLAVRHRLYDFYFKKKMIFNFQLDERLIQGGTLAFGLFFVLVGVFQILTKKIIYIKFRGVGCSNRGRSTMASCHVGWSAGVTLARSFGQSQISYSHKHNFHIFNNFLTCMYKCT